MAKVCKVLSILCFAILALHGCGTKSAPELTMSGQFVGIVGGQTSHESKLSQKVALILFTQKAPAGSFSESAVQCTGTFIERNVVLTAAHCLKKKFDRIDITLQATSEQAYFATTGRRWVTHTSFKTIVDTEFDLALIRTETPLPQNLEPISLASALPKAETSVLAAGFGRSVYAPPELVDPLLGTTLRALVLAMPSFSYFDSQQKIVIETGGTLGINLGDSGGPLIKVANGRIEQIGVASSGRVLKPGVLGTAVYVSIPKVLSWIHYAKTKL